MIGARLLAVSVAALSLAAPVRAADACRGTLSGMVKGAFDCTARIVTLGEGKGAFEIRPAGPIDGVPAYQPGAFEIALPPRPGTYGLDALGMGKASVAADGGAFYSATKTTGQRGEVTLVLRSVKPDPEAAGTWIVHGTYRARLIPAGAGKEGDVVVEASF